MQSVQHLLKTPGCCQPRDAHTPVQLLGFRMERNVMGDSALCNEAEDGPLCHTMGKGRTHSCWGSRTERHWQKIMT